MKFFLSSRNFNDFEITHASDDQLKAMMEMKKCYFLCHGLKNNKNSAMNKDGKKAHLEKEDCNVCMIKT